MSVKARSFPDDPNKITKHHKLPESLGGRWDRRNRSFVPLYKHQAWHHLFDNLPVSTIIQLLKGYYEIFGIDIVKSDLQREINEGWANANDERIKNRKAWYALFEGMTLSEIIIEINHFWIDPDYELCVGIERIQKIEMKRLS